MFYYTTLIPKVGMLGKKHAFICKFHGVTVIPNHLHVVIIFKLTYTADYQWKMKLTRC